MPVLHGEVALLRDTLTLSLFQGSQETDLGPVVWTSVPRFSGGVSRMALEEASTQNQVEGGIEPRDSPTGGSAVGRRAVSKKPCRGVWNRSKNITIATSCSMQVGPGDRVKAGKDFCLT